MSRKSDAENDRLDDAARAGWLYYIAGNTQDEIAKKLGVSLAKVKTDILRARTALAAIIARSGARHETLNA